MHSELLAGIFFWGDFCTLQSAGPHGPTIPLGTPHEGVSVIFTLWVAKGHTNLAGEPGLHDIDLLGSDPTSNIAVPQLGWLTIVPSVFVALTPFRRSFPSLKFQSVCYD